MNGLAQIVSILTDRAVAARAADTSKRYTYSMGKAVVSVTCKSCGTKYRTIIKKSGKQARSCPSCGSPESTKNQSEPEDSEE